MIPRCKMNKKAGLVTLRGHVRICLERGSETGRGKRREGERERDVERETQERRGRRRRRKNLKEWDEEGKIRGEDGKVKKNVHIRFDRLEILAFSCYSRWLRTRHCKWHQLVGSLSLRIQANFLNTWIYLLYTNAVKSTVHGEVRAALEGKLRQLLRRRGRRRQWRRRGSRRRRRSLALK